MSGRVLLFLLLALVLTPGCSQRKPAGPPPAGKSDAAPSASPSAGLSTAADPEPDSADTPENSENR